MNLNEVVFGVGFLLFDDEIALAVGPEQFSGVSIEVVVFLLEFFQVFSFVVVKSGVHLKKFHGIFMDIFAPQNTLKTDLMIFLTIQF